VPALFSLTGCNAMDYIDDSKRVQMLSMAAVVVGLLLGVVMVAALG